MNRFTKPFLIALLIVALDQALKTWVRCTMYMGQEFSVIGSWFKIHFIENNGMAYGYEFAGEYGKIFLTLFRIVAVFGIAFLIRYCIRNRYNPGLVFCLSLILAGALGNIIDSVFYGLIYGYAPILHGRVVDMLYFPIIQGTYPKWLPGVGGEEFIFFSPVFNLADSAISIGVICILFFQKHYFKNNRPKAQQDFHNSEVLEI